MSDLKQYLIEEFLEDYQKGEMSRRDVLRRLVAITGSLAAANALLAACSPGPSSGTASQPQTASTPAPANPTTVQAPATATSAPPTSVPATTVPTSAPAASAAVTTAPTAAQITQIATRAVLTTTATAPTRPSPTVPAGVRVNADDPNLEGQNVQFPNGSATILGYLAKPKGNGPFPAVVVCHENRGLLEHIKDVTRRLTRAGYVGLAVDLLSRQGGTDKVSDQAQVPGILANTPPDTYIQDFQAGLKYLQTQPFVAQGKFGMVGFCFGGGITWQVITKTPEIKAAVPFYGPNPPLENVPGIQAAVLGLYGGDDQRIDAGIPAIEAAMKQNNKIYEKIIYPGANHAFNNDTGASYNAVAAIDAWAKAIAWFDKYLKA